MGERDEHGLEAVMKLGRFQKVRETRALAVLCFAMYEKMGTPWYLQLDQAEVTDGRIMRMSPIKHGEMELLRVEHTSYMQRNDGKPPTDSLLEQLKRTKARAEEHNYGVHDLVLVDLGNNMNPDYKEIAAYLQTIDAPYQLWLMEQVDHDNEDTIIQITTCTTRVGQMKLDVGKAWHEQLEKEIRGVLVSQQTTDTSKVGIQSRHEPITRAPWDFNGSLSAESGRTCRPPHK